MTKTNAVALNDMELDMVAGGGFIQDLKNMRDTFKDKPEDTPVQRCLKNVFGTLLVGALGYGIFKTFVPFG